MEKALVGRKPIKTIKRNNRVRQNGIFLSVYYFSWG